MEVFSKCYHFTRITSNLMLCKELDTWQTLVAAQTCHTLLTIRIGLRGLTAHT